MLKVIGTYFHIFFTVDFNYFVSLSALYSFISHFFQYFIYYVINTFWKFRIWVIMLRLLHKLNQFFPKRKASWKLHHEECSQRWHSTISWKLSALVVRSGLDAFLTQNTITIRATSSWKHFSIPAFELFFILFCYKFYIFQSKPEDTDVLST